MESKYRLALAIAIGVSIGAGTLWAGLRLILAILIASEPRVERRRRFRKVIHYRTAIFALK